MNTPGRVSRERFDKLSGKVSRERFEQLSGLVSSRRVRELELEAAARVALGKLRVEQRQAASPVVSKEPPTVARFYNPITRGEHVRGAFRNPIHPTTAA